ncbi:MAG: zinc ABC transporter substrate-binding protein [Dehalococcoidia bacterium]|nr:zinc ABC transporter substrate-binding protein [Dehalococcoidia bacterium]
MPHRASGWRLSRFVSSRPGLQLLLLVLLAGPACTESPMTYPVGAIGIVAAENFYGNIAEQIGGDRVMVTSLLSDPNADPHAYESNAADAKAVATARIIIKNGLGYDAFIDKLAGASPRPNRTVISVGDLTGHKEGDNPHIWYDPTTMSKLAETLASSLAQVDPAGADYYSGRLQAFGSSMKIVNDQIAAIKAQYQAVRIIATEPVFDYMAGVLALDLVGKGGAFQRAVADGNDPPAAAVADFRQQLSSGGVKVLIYNSQAVTPMSVQMQDYARQRNIPVMAVTETEPAGQSYQQWMLDQLKKLQSLLSGQGG